MYEQSTHTYSLVLSQLLSVIIPLILHVHIHSSATDATQSKILDSGINTLQSGDDLSRFFCYMRQWPVATFVVFSRVVL